MANWRSQTFRTAAKKAGATNSVITNALAVARHLNNSTAGAPPIFTLRHLAHLTAARYDKLRALAARRGDEPYRLHRMLKRPLPGEPVRYRIIAVPSPWLMSTQRWINQNILMHVAPHKASRAFAPGCNLIKATEDHCAARWLIKIDLRNFFETVTESQVYRVFHEVGYQPLVAFELARICTRQGQVQSKRWHRRFRTKASRYSQIPEYRTALQGHLPQGAPTSPMLANLVARSLDIALSTIAAKHGFVYTRYADDLAFSTEIETIDRLNVRALISVVYNAIAANGFTPNRAKTVVSPPGARKILLGLNISCDEPKLTREYKLALRQHLYYLRSKSVGPAAHAAHNKATVYGLRNHVFGLIQHARQIERSYGDARAIEFNSVTW